MNREKIIANAAKGYGYAGHAGMTLEEFREQSRKETFERFEEKKRLEAERLERVRQEEETAKVPLHEEMRRKVAYMHDSLSDLQAGDPRAVSVIRQYLLDALGIVAYILDGGVNNEQGTV